MVGAVDQRSSLTFETRVRFPYTLSHCLLLVLALLRGFFSGFPPSTDTNTSKFQLIWTSGPPLITVVATEGDTFFKYQLF